MNRTTLGHMTAAGLFALGIGHAFANPTGGTVAAGSATINTIPGTVTVTQASNVAIINWNTFSIASGELTKFVQPSSTSAVLNRVTGGGISSINGTLSANGQVLLINGNGIVIGSGGAVNANGFLASTRDIDDNDLLNGNLHFTGSNPNGVQNLGTITVSGTGVALIGKTVDNQGTISAANGTVGLASGDDVLITLSGQPHIFVNPSPTATSASTQTAIHNSGTISAASAELKAANGNLFALAINNEGTIRATQVCNQGGHIYLTTDAGMIQNTGTLSAKKGKNGGTIKVSGGSLWNRNTIDVSGQQGGKVVVNSQNIQNDGTITAKGTKSGGGTVDLTYSGNALGSVKGLIDASGVTGGGTIDFLGTGQTSEAYLSLTLDVNSTCGVGGSVDIDTPTLYLTGATIEATGAYGGGRIFIGEGDPNVSPDLPLAQIAYISLGTNIYANASVNGNGGDIGITSTVLSNFQGVALADGLGAGKTAGNISITGPAAVTPVGSPVLYTVKGKLASAVGITPAVASTGGTTSTTTTAFSAFEFVDPDASPGDAFGRPYTGLFNLSSNRTLITAPGDSFGGANAGAVYLFSDSTGALLSTLRGTHAGDEIGTTVQLFSGGNFAIESPIWNGGYGAVTFGNGLTGFANGGGSISASNSLIGSAVGDSVGSGGLFPLFNGNYLVLSPDWNSGAGAVTYVKPSVGLVGAVSSTNSLVGESSGDSIGSGGVVQLSNGANFLVLSPSWNGGAGAITGGSDTLGLTGTVSSSNSLVGASSGDHVGSAGSVTDSGLGYFLATSLDFDGGAGAVTWSMDSAPLTGTVSSTNSLVGTNSTDEIGSGGITILFNNHNYVVDSPDWGGGAGAVTVGSGSLGGKGSVGSTNSYVGSASTDHIGSGGITVLFDNGHFVIDSPEWSNNTGAVTLASGTPGIGGAIGSSNSLIGANPGDMIGIGGVAVLDSGDFLVLSPNFNSNAGAVTWSSDSVGTVGAVTSSNSLVGQNSGDMIGSGGIFQLSNGTNYLVLSPSWSGGKGAVTNGNNSSALTGVVNDSTSLVGVSDGDGVGSAGSIYDSFSANGYYLVDTSNFNNGGGAVTWNSATGRTGQITASNSLVGASGDHVGGIVTDDDGTISVTDGGIGILYNGNYVVESPDWNSSTGAVTWGSAAGGVSGQINSGNSLIGANAGDKIGSGGIFQLSNGTNYLVLSPNWNGGMGAVTNLSSSSATGDIVGASNSLVGSHAGDDVGATGTIRDSFDGYYLVVTNDWNGDAGAVTWNSDIGGPVGAISSTNSLVGSSSSDNVGLAGVTILFNGNYVVNSPNWNNQTGAVTWGSENSGISGTIGAGNSLIGANAGDAIGSGGIETLANNNYLILSPNFNGTAGAITLGNGTSGTIGTVGGSNSLVGSSEGDSIGSGGIVQLSNGTNYLVLSPTWGGGKGAITEGSDSVALTGTVSSSNSLVGASTSDAVGTFGSIIDANTGYYLVRTLGFDGGAGALTWSSDSVGTKGVVSSANSLVGASSGDAVSSGGVAFLDDGNYVVLTPNFDGGAGAVTWGSKSGGASGVIGATNSLVGSDASDHIGSGGLIFLSNGNYLVQSPLFNGSAGAVTWGSEASGVVGTVSAANSITGGGSDSGEEYAGQSADGSIYLISFTTDSSKGGDGRVIAGSVNGPTSSTTISTTEDFFIDPTVISVESSEFGYQESNTGFYISNPEAIPLEPVSVDAITGGAVNDGKGSNIANGSSTSNAPGVNRLVTPGNGVWNIFGGIVHSTPPPFFVTQQLQFNLSPAVYAHLNDILFGQH